MLKKTLSLYPTIRTNMLRCGLKPHRTTNITILYPPTSTHLSKSRKVNSRCKLRSTRSRYSSTNPVGIRAWFVFEHGQNTFKRVYVMVNCTQYAKCGWQHISNSPAFPCSVSKTNTSVSLVAALTCASTQFQMKSDQNKFL
jgi:hypothetical protein